MIDVSCQCGARYRVPPQYVGKRLKCKRCSGPVPVPPPEQLEDSGGYEVDELAGETPRAILGVATVPPIGSVAVRTPTGVTEGRGRLSEYLKDCATSLMFFAESGNLPRFLVVAGIAAFSPLLMFGLCIGQIATIIVYGWIFSFLFNVLLNAADGERDLPELTLLEGYFETVIVPFFKFLATLAIAFSPAAVYGIATLDNANPDDPAMIALLAAGVFFWPMIMLMVGIGGVSSLARPDLVIVTLIKTIGPYIAVCILTAGVVAGSTYINEAVWNTSTTGAEHPVAMIGALRVLELYAWVLVMRFIGLYYHHFKRRFAWSWA